MSYSPVSPLRRSILSQLLHDEILARTNDALDEIYQAAVLKNTRAMLVIGRPQSGKTELLKLTFDRLFNEQGRTLPVYFNVRRDRLTPEKFTKDFLLTLLRQYLAFVQNDAEMVQRHELTERELLSQAPPSDYAALRDIVDGYFMRVNNGDQRALLRYTLGLPQRLASRSMYHLAVLIDEAHLLDRVVIDEEFANLFGEVLQQPYSVSFILTGQQRTLLDQLAAEEGLIGSVKLLHFDQPDFKTTQALMKRWCFEEGVPFQTETGQLAVQQLENNLFYLRSLALAASERKIPCDKSADFERLYVAELLQGRIAHYFSRLLRQIASDAANGQSGEQAAIEIVYICSEALESRAPVELIAGKLSPRIDVPALLTELHRQELITLLDGHILPAEDAVFCDWITATNRRFNGGNLEEVKVDLLRRKIKEIPQVLALSSIRTLHKKIETLLRRCDGQKVARSLFANDEFVIRYGHATYEIMLAGLEAETEQVQLPQVIHVAEGDLFGYRHDRLPGTWSYLLAFGFEQGVYDQDHEIIWLLAVADSPSPISAEAVQSLDQQLKDVQHSLQLNQSPDKPPTKVVRWAISKMGFTPDGTLALTERGFSASDYLQLELMSVLMDRHPARRPNESSTNDESQITLPSQLSFLDEERTAPVTVSSSSPAAESESATALSAEHAEHTATEQLPLLTGLANETDAVAVSEIAPQPIEASATSSEPEATSAAMVEAAGAPEAHDERNDQTVPTASTEDEDIDVQAVAPVTVEPASESAAVNAITVTTEPENTVDVMVQETAPTTSDATTFTTLQLPAELDDPLEVHPLVSEQNTGLNIVTVEEAPEVAQRSAQPVNAAETVAVGAMSTTPVPLSAEAIRKTIAPAKELELEIPVNDDKEIVAARVAERMARHAGFAPEGVNQIKTALIEACLSLASTSTETDGKIFQRYQLDDEKMTITIANEAVGLDDQVGVTIEEDPEKIWRIDVLRSLMDIVVVRKLDYGWRVELARFIPPPSA